ncbi:MAG: hypothetical protein ACRDV3_14460 [Acidothermaceae bacterium]
MTEPERIEELLRAAMRARTDGTVVAPGLARTALRGAARGRRVQYATTAAASVAAVGAVSAVGVAVQHSWRGGAAPALGTIPSASSSCYDTASPTPGAPSASATAAVGSAPASQALGSMAPSTPTLSPGADNPPMSHAPSQIEAVTLPDPAPGYPLRRGNDAVIPTGFGASSNYWTATFTLAQTPADSHTAANGVVDTEPAGPEATVLVIDGHPFDLANPTSIEGVPVSETTTVLGHKAWITSACDQTDVVFSTGRFQVLLAGFPGGNDSVRDANLVRLTALADALRGLQ